MPTDNDIGKALDKAAYSDFPPHDQGHPQTARTRRVRSILETAIALSGAEIEVYNFHERPGIVYFNVRYDDTWVTAGAENFKALDALTDAALIEQWIPRTLQFGTSSGGGKVMKTD